MFLTNWAAIKTGKSLFFSSVVVDFFFFWLSFFLLIFLMFMFVNFLKCFYLFLKERETEHERGRGRGRGRHRIWSRLQALSCQHRARHGAQTHKLWDHDLNRSQTLNQLSHPGTPINYVFFYFYFFRKFGRYHLTFNSI